MATRSSVLAGKFHGQRSLVGTVHVVTNSQTQTEHRNARVRAYTHTHTRHHKRAYVQVFTWTYAFFSLRWTPRREMIGLSGRCVLNLLRNKQIISKWLYHFTFPSAMSESSVSCTGTNIWLIVYSIWTIDLYEVWEVCNNLINLSCVDHPKLNSDLKINFEVHTVQIYWEKQLNKYDHYHRICSISVVKIFLYRDQKMLPCHSQCL